MRRTWVRIAVAAIVVAAFAAALVRVKPADVGEAIGAMSWRWAIAAAIINLLTVVTEATRWRLVLSPVSRPSLLVATEALLLGFTANLLLPYKLGDSARVVSLARWQSVPIATVAATVVLDRVIDAATFFLWVAPVTSVFGARGAHTSITRSGAVVVVLVVLVAAAWWARRRPSAERSAEEGGAAGFIARMLDGLRVLRDGRRFPALAAIAMLAWAGRAAVVWCMLHAFHLQLPLLAALSALIAINIGISVVAAPGNIGVYEMSAAGALALWGVPSAVGVSCAIAMHAAELIPVVTLGLIVLVATGVRLTEPVGDP